MSELQATLEFSVELNKFYNVDLFQRGYYQIRTALKTPPKVPSKIEITLQKSQGEGVNLPAHVLNDTAVSRTFQILYRNEDVTINDVVLYRFHTLIDSNKMEEEMQKLEIQLVLELWFSEEQNGLTSVNNRSECVSTRTLQLHFSATKGLHHHVPILFDYFHLSAIEVTVHGTLIAIHQPFINVPKQPRTAWSSRNPDLSTLETVYFGVRPISGDPDQCLPINLHAAWQMHHRICNLLLSSFESLQATFEHYLNDILGSQYKLEHVDCHSKLRSLMDSIQLLDNEEELIQNGTRDITQLCAGNVILWTQFLESATLDQGVIFHLAKEHHSSRIKRLAEAFFTHEYQKNECLACFEPSYHGHTDLATMVRSSMYLQTLPPLDVECLDLDGDHTSLPIVFEDIYFDQTSTGDSPHNRSSRSGSMSPSYSQNSSPSMRSKPKRRFIKNIKPETFKRPSSYSCTDAEAASARPSAKDVTLVGYRKTIASPNVHSRVMENARLEIGTLSPSTSTDSTTTVPYSSFMTASTSMPALSRSGWGRNSEGTLPEYREVARQSLREKNKKFKSSIISVDFGGSNPEIKAEEVNNTNDDYRKRLKRTYTDPIRHAAISKATSMISEMENSHNISTTVETVSKTDSETSKGATVDNKGATVDSISSHEPITAKKQLDFQKEMMQNLSDCLTQALGDENLHDSDKSDDETCVQNGYDEFLDQDSGSQPPYLISNDSTHVADKRPSHVRKDIGNISANEMRESGKSQTGLTVRDILKNNDLKITSSSRRETEFGVDHGVITHDGSVGHGVITHDGMVNSVNEVNSRMEDVLSISEINVSKGSPLTDSDSCITLTSSQTSLDVKGTAATQGIICDETNKITVIEMLKEEYKRSEHDRLHSDLVASNSDFSDSGISAMSVRNSQKSSSDSNILQSVDNESSEGLLEVKKPSDLVSSASFPELSKLSEQAKESPKLVKKVGPRTVSFVQMRENLKSRMKYQGHLYSERSTLASTIPFFHVPESLEDEHQMGCHLIICVHGLDGNSADLRLIKTYIEMALPGYKLEFLMAERNQTDTFADFEVMTIRLVKEILSHIELFSLNIGRLSFVGHSLGNVLIRAVLASDDMIPLLPKLYTFLSLSGPHLGTLYNSSGLVNMGMWFMQKWKKSGSLLQLSLKDHLDPRQSFLYRLSRKPGMEFFKHVLLVGSSQDRYVPYHSSRIEMCKAAQRESSGLGSVYSEMVNNILQPIVNNPRCKLIRYDIFHALPSTANTIIGRAAHIAVLDSEIFIEKFMMVTALKYFK